MKEEKGYVFEIMLIFLFVFGLVILMFFLSEQTYKRLGQEYCEEEGYELLTAYKKGVIYYDIECDNSKIYKDCNINYGCQARDKWGDCTKNVSYMICWDLD